MSAPVASRAFHLMIKPAGAACNLACEYCYYRERVAGHTARELQMTEQTLAQVTEAYLRANPAPEVTFGWQGGEPLLAGLPFFRRARELQRQFARPGQRVLNALQTNGTRLDAEWARFLAEEEFLVGISLDGPPELHDHYRRDHAGGASYARTLAGLRLLQEHGVEHNALVTVNRANGGRPREVYEHLTGLGLEHLQFIPVVERVSRDTRKVTPWTVRPEVYGDFLVTVFDHWARRDVGRVFVQTFESALNVWLGRPATLCVFAPRCGAALAVEHDGELFACDHFVYPEHHRGVVTAEALAGLVEGEAQRAFGDAKADLAAECRACPVRHLCEGDCPKHRLRRGVDGRPISYLCAAYRRFFTHRAPVLQAMANEIRVGRPASNVMEVLQLASTTTRGAPA